MDEMKTLQGLRADAPTPDHARLAPGRQRLLDVSARRDPSWRGRVRWKIVAPAAAALVTAAAVLATQVATKPSEHSVQPMSDGTTMLLELVERLEDNPQIPGTIASVAPEKWVYRDEVSTSGNMTPDVLKPLLKGSLCPREQTGKAYAWRMEFWDLGDSTKRAVKDDGGPCLPRDRKLRVINTPAYKEPEMRDRAFAANAPTDPDAFMRALRIHQEGMSRGGDQAARDFNALGAFFSEPVGMTPRLRATILRSLVAVPGVTVAERPVMDPLGRSVLAVGRKNDEPQAQGVRDEVLIDPVTGAYLGKRAVATVPVQHDLKKKGDRKGPRTEAGQVEEWFLLAKTAVVDASGQRP
ncbi:MULTISPECIES: CU044_5270 family protein [Streptomyces]|uniref:CU044_5270 family protein n=1 Tax=Streptomyces solicathayae TaxID=3081768 RepID=A0ABZ0M0A3_9ACTN|nr:CU044_5270 family protein [Streptomyces sp. HUAS YS2]WOX25098.1 CU044_5270 family protein [Streptomyces sp. HUAS YS2]